MRKVILQFSDQPDLRRFMQVVRCVELEVNFHTITLICDCDEAEIELAKSAFNATVISEQPTSS